MGFCKSNVIRRKGDERRFADYVNGKRVIKSFSGHMVRR
jgi:hypothetical protein